MKTWIRIAAVLALALAPVSARAQQAAPSAAATPSLTVVAENRTAAAEAERGAPRRNVAVQPGDVVRYRLTFTNPTAGAVRGVVLANPLPAAMQLVAGSTRATRQDARLEFSADRGRTFSRQPMEEVVVDGQRVRRPVAPEKYTHVRWTVDGTVAPRATVVAEFDARLAAPARQAGPAAGPAAGTSGR